MKIKVSTVDCDISRYRRQEVIEHLKEYYGADHVSHIGNYSMYGVKSSIKDVARVYNLPFKESLEISKAIDELSTDPNLSFNMIDSWEQLEPMMYKQWKTLEDKYPEIIDIARHLEGMPRQAGIHASGILVTPIPVTDIIPVRYEKGVAISLWDGVTLDELGFCKLDILGLVSMDTIQSIIRLIHPSTTLEDLYRSINMDDPAVYEVIRDKKTDAVFQLESNVMKQILDIMKPDTFDDLIAINALVRPGPLSCKMHEDYAKRKHGEVLDIRYPIRGCEDILDSTYGVICFQEQLMQISKKIAGFDDMQADILTRKTIAKKRQDMWHMLIRCHTYGKKNIEGPTGWDLDDSLPWYDPKGKYGGEISGAISQGYTRKEIEDFFQSIERYSSYCFNKSHSATYSFIGLCMAWLKTYYPTEFWCAVLSTEEDKDQRQRYIECAEQEGIVVRKPDIRFSASDFSIHGKDILFGLGAIQLVGGTLLVALDEERKNNGPFEGLEDIRNRIPKKILRANSLANMIKAGCFDFENQNRVELLNYIRDPKSKTEPLDPDIWCEPLCIEYEKEVLNIPITYKPWWDTVKELDSITIDVTLHDIKQCISKNMRAYGRGKFTYKDHDGDCMLWPAVFTQYLKMSEAKETTGEYKVTGIKEKGFLKINRIKPVPKDEEE